MEQGFLCWCQQVMDSWGTLKPSSNAFPSDLNQPRARALPAYIVLQSISQLLCGPAPVPRVTVSPAQKWMQCHVSHFPVASQTKDHSTVLLPLPTRGEEAHLEHLCTLQNLLLLCIWSKGWRQPFHLTFALEAGKLQVIHGLAAQCPMSPACSGTQPQHSNTARISCKMHLRLITPREEKQRMQPLGSDFLPLPGASRCGLDDTKLG